jgi:hypothetical protein
MFFDIYPFNLAKCPKKMSFLMSYLQMALETAFEI